jgi:hypothetical protein
MELTQQCTRIHGLKNYLRIKQAAGAPADQLARAFAMYCGRHVFILQQQKIAN